MKLSTVLLLCPALAMAQVPPTPSETKSGPPAPASATHAAAESEAVKRPEPEPAPSVKPSKIVIQAARKAAEAVGKAAASATSPAAAAEPTILEKVGGAIKDTVLHPIDTAKKVIETEIEGAKIIKDKIVDGLGAARDWLLGR
jgi:hypothetical protein